MSGLPRPVRDGGGARYNLTARARLEQVQATALTPAYVVAEARLEGRGVPYIARRIVAQGPPVAPLRIYTGDPTPINVADGVPAPTDSSPSFYVADYFQPLYVEPFLALVFRWGGPGIGFLEPSDGTPLGLVRVELEELA